MRYCTIPSVPLLGAMAATMLLSNLIEPASATTETPAAVAPRSSDTAAAPVSGSSAGPAETVTATPTQATPTTAAAEPVAEPAKPKPLPPTLVARINLTTQTMVVLANGKQIHTWRVSSGAPGYATPPGTFKPGWMAKDWRSRQYDDAPMPYSVFFNGGIAVHGTMNPGSLGRAASHGCVRLATSNAATFFKLVSRHGLAQTRIVVHGPQPFGRNDAVAARKRKQNVRSASDWVYVPSTPAAQRRAGRIDSYGYAPAPQPRRISSARTASPYWARY